MNNKSSNKRRKENHNKSNSKTKKQTRSNNKIINNFEPNIISPKKIVASTLKSNIHTLNTTSLNYVHHEFNRSLRGNFYSPNTDKVQKMIITKQLKNFTVYNTHNPFERRVTYLTWHPYYPELIVAGSKGGELILLNINNNEKHFCPGMGPGGSIVGLKFSEDVHIVYTTSVNGIIRKEDFTGKASKNIMSSSVQWATWFSCLDVCNERKLLLTGDTNGYGFLLNTNGRKEFTTKKFHKFKITHCEFNRLDPNIFVTSSIDQTVKLWDIRLIKTPENSLTSEPLRLFQHVKGVNSAYFSPADGQNLLTTDQYSELRVYSKPCWDTTLCIKHPHRPFQHMTHIKATWHPLKDIIVVGRYPDNNVFKNDKRTIDFYDAMDGELMHRIISPTGNIVSLNEFNCLGDTLATAAGYNIGFLRNEDTFKK